MSATMAGSGEDWVRFYNQHSHPGQSSAATFFSGDRVSDATVVTTNLTSATSASQYGVNPGPVGVGGSGGYLSPEGRVSKPARRRSRASRRTPTTLLSTDTANFRAMVQQFTGGPCGPFSSPAQHPPPPTTGLAYSYAGRPYGQGSMNPPPAGAVFPGYQSQLQQQLQLQQQQYLASLNSNNSNSEGSNNGGETFFQRLSNPPARAGLGESGGFLLEGLTSHLSPTDPRANPSDDGTTANGYMF